MVTGIESFKEWFKGNESQYAIIGGTACDILMTEEGLDFRATKDIDLVLIIEAVDAAFGRKFWDYVKQAGYEHCNKSSGMPQFYRFSHPMSNRYPAMIELFTRKLDAIQLPDDAVLTPLPMDEDISSLSAILLDDDYYEFLKQGKVTVDGVTVLDAAYLIPFKAKAWMDLTDRKEAGEHVDSKNIKKHAALPSEEEINDYAHKMSVYKTITNGGVALKLRVLNKGTAKATDIRISIVFPKDIFVYDIDDIEKMKEPKAPKLPPNPIEKAEERFMSDLNPVYGLLKNSMDGMQPFYSARSLPIIDPAIFNNSNSSVFESISIRDNSIFAECNQLPHKDDTEFDGIYIVPARKGKFKVSVSLMCSEYIEPKVHDIEFEIV